ncbi:hypothetical protein ACTS9C_15700 [Empedobacter brevis]
MKKIYITLFTLLSITSYSQYITNNSTVANYTANLRHNGTLAIGDKNITDFSATPLQVRYSTNRAIHIPIYNSLGGFQLNVSHCNGCFAPTAKPGDNIIKTSKDTYFHMDNNNSVDPNEDTSTPYSSGITRFIFNDFVNKSSLVIFNTGKVTMGTDNYDTSGYRLFVKDGIKTERLKVEVASANQWADHVFNDDYTLMPLNEVKTFITTNKHLPNIPSAHEIVTEGGIEQGELNAKLLEKIEELTLHLIEQNEKMIQQNKKIEGLEKQVQALTK